MQTQTSFALHSKLICRSQDLLTFNILTYVPANLVPMYSQLQK